MANFEFKPIPTASTDAPSTVPSWNDGKIIIDDWSLNINIIPNLPTQPPTPENEKPTLTSEETPLPPNVKEEEVTWSAILIEDWNIPDKNRPPSPPRPPPHHQNPIKQEHASMHGYLTADVIKARTCGHTRFKTIKALVLVRG